MAEPNNNLLQLLLSTLEDAGLPTLHDMVEIMGPKEWQKVADTLRQKNLVFSQAFEAVANFYHMQAKQKDTWPYVAIIGHSKEPEEFTYLEKEELKRRHVVTVSQLFEERGGFLTSHFNMRLNNLTPRLTFKLRLLQRKIKTVFKNFNEHTQCQNTLLNFFLSKQCNISQIFMKLMRNTADKTIGTPPSRLTRIRDHISVPDVDTYMKAYDICKISIISSKTKEIAFQIPNRTLWSQNKAFLSGHHDRECPYCEPTESTEHMILNCNKMAYPLWEEAQGLISQFLEKLLPDSRVGAQRVRLTYRNIIYHEPIAELKTYKATPATHKVLLLLICEIKRDLYYRRVSAMTENQTEQKVVISSLKRRFILYATVQKVISYLEYLGTATWLRHARSLSQGLMAHKDQILLNEQY